MPGPFHGITTACTSQAATRGGVRCSIHRSIAAMIATAGREKQHNSWWLVAADVDDNPGRNQDPMETRVYPS